MRGKIQNQYRSLFNPWFITAIMGQVTKLSINELENNAEKYVNSPVAYMYEDIDNLKKRVKSRSTQEVEKIDMNDVNRGDLFDPEFESFKTKLINKFKSDQKAKTAKVKSRLEQNRKRLAEAEKAKKKAIRDAVNKAKKAQEKESETQS